MWTTLTFLVILDIFIMTNDYLVTVEQEREKKIWRWHFSQINLSGKVNSDNLEPSVDSCCNYRHVLIKLSSPINEQVHKREQALEESVQACDGQNVWACDRQWVYVLNVREWVLHTARLKLKNRKKETMKDGWPKTWLNHKCRQLRSRRSSRQLAAQKALS